ncbi:glycosyltransferase [Photobacterium carnosum]|uniref:glycosyltransferase n=1 Tax=Photobacterium carnosum TaxID=2023717 RepID=UPI001F30AE3B|nr:glycosyltransferase [Photobacterium carnosum]
MKVDILLATYNGEKYIEEQILSILKQTFSGFNLIIRDDGSTDNTLSKIALIKDDRIRVVRDNLGSLGPAGNFRELITISNADLLFFSDQDDVWDQNKLKVTIDKFDHCNEPTLVYTNAEVVDQDLNSLLYNTYNVEVEPSPVSFFFNNGGLQGCSMAVNRQLVDIIDFKNISWYMHDLVFTFYASCFGRIIFINEKMFKYRQHNNNVLGYKKSTLKKYISQFCNKNFLLRKECYYFFKSFYECENKNLDPEYREMIATFLSVVNEGDIFSFLLFVKKYNLKLKDSQIKLISKYFYCRFKVCDL